MDEKTLATDSLVLFRNSQGAESRGTLVRLTRNLAVFEVYNPYSIVQLSEVLDELRIRRGDRTTYSGRAVVSNIVSTGLLLIVSVTLVDPWADLVDLSSGPELGQEVRRFVDDWEHSHHHLRPSYVLSVSKVRNFLQELNRWLEHGETVAGLREAETQNDQIQQFVADVEQEVGNKLDELFVGFEHEARLVHDDELIAAKAYTRRELHPLILCAPFVHRIYTKPLGYAGDCEMVKMIMHDRWQGNSTYAKLVNSTFLRSNTAEAHRNRITELTTHLQSEHQRVTQNGRVLRVLNVGCGPAVEVQRFIRELNDPARCSFTLMDFNQETLEYVKSQVDGALRQSHQPDISVEYRHRSIHNLLKEAAGRKNGIGPFYDVVYCAGLFDYLSDRICRRLLRLFHHWTLPGGLVLTTNVHTNNPIKGTMEHLAEWYLILRDEDDMLALAPELDVQRVKTERTGVNVFLEIRKTGAMTHQEFTI